MDPQSYETAGISSFRTMKIEKLDHQSKLILMLYAPGRARSEKRVLSLILTEKAPICDK